MEGNCYGGTENLSDYTFKMLVFRKLLIFWALDRKMPLGLRKAVKTSKNESAK
jgi:hypothetical protein